MLAVYVFGIVVDAWIYALTFVSPYVPTQVFPIEKHPVVILYPTLEVDVAKPAMLSPRSVVVPKPERAISKAEIDEVAVPAMVVVDI